MKIVSKKIRASARGEDCTLRIYPHCNFNNETTVLAHIKDGTQGFGLKANDINGVYACSMCHDIIDGRVKHDAIEEEILKCKIRAMQKTIMRLIEKGLVKIQ